MSAQNQTKAGGIVYNWRGGDYYGRGDAFTLDILSTPRFLPDEVLDEAALEMGKMRRRYDTESFFARHARRVLEAWRRDAI
jgi:hypothetical protein